MKKNILLLMALVITAFADAQVSLGLVNDFEDGTTGGWSNGGGSPNPPANIPDGGPDGASDNYLEEISAGGGGAGSRLVMFNVSSDWTGDYIAADTGLLTMDVRNSGATTISLRVAFSGGPDETEMSTTDMIELAPGGDWQEVVIDLRPAAMTIIDGADSAADVLSAVEEIRILSNPVPSFIGEQIAATLDVDNLFLDGFLSVEDNLASSLNLFPNPVKDELNVTANQEMQQYKIVNVLGAVVAEGSLAGTSSMINVADLSSGIYLIEIQTNDERSVKKLIKQ